MHNSVSSKKTHVYLLKYLILFRPKVRQLRVKSKKPDTPYPDGDDGLFKLRYKNPDEYVHHKPAGIIQAIGTLLPGSR